MARIYVRVIADLMSLSVAIVLVAVSVEGQVTTAKTGTRSHVIAKQFTIDAPADVNVAAVFPGEHVSAVVAGEKFEVRVYVGRTAGRSDPPVPGDRRRLRAPFTVGSQSGWIDRWWRVNSEAPSRHYALEVCVELSTAYVMTAHASCSTQAACTDAEQIVKTVHLIDAEPLGHSGRPSRCSSH